MRTGITLFFVFGIGLVFDYWKVGPVPEFHKVFPLSNQSLTYQYYVWAIFEKISLLLIVFLWYKESIEYSRPFVLIFLFLMIGDFVDFMISYNELKYFGLTYNMWFVILYFLFLIIMAWKER